MSIKTSTPQTRKPGANGHSITFAVYFNNGVSAVRPWQVGAKEGRAIAAHLGSFSRFEYALGHACNLARTSGAIVTVPSWLEAK